MPKKKSIRSTEEIFLADYLRVYDEVPVRYGIPPSTASRYAKEQRIVTFGKHPRMVKAAHFEEQLEKGFPVIS